MSQLVEQDDEIDLGELFAAVWYNWWIVALASILAFLCAGYYAFKVVTPEYEAASRFEFLDRQNNTSGLGQFAAFAGLLAPTQSSEVDAMEDRILTRPFVASISEEYDFISDPVFNSRLRPPSSIDKLRTWIFGELPQTQLTTNDYLVMAVNALNQRMTIDAGDNGIVELSIRHPDPGHASDLANIIVERALLDAFQREASEVRDSLNYFSDQLLRVRSDLDTANKALRDYAVNSSLQSQDELARLSGQLSQVRRDIEGIDDSLIALGEIGSEEFVGAEFAQSYPVATSLSFRRLLNLPGDPNRWEQPTVDTVADAIASLRAQRSSLVSSLKALEARAKSSGSDALELDALRREVEVQQTVFEAVVTQFESQSLISGIERRSGTVLEEAIPPRGPASPNKTLILFVGALLGAFVGAVCALIKSGISGNIYTIQGLRERFGLADYRVKAESQIGKLRKKDLNTKQRTSIEDLLVSINQNANVLAVIPTGRSNLAARLSLSSMKVYASRERKTALLDLTNGSFSKICPTASMTKGDDFFKCALVNGTDLLMPKDTESFLEIASCEKLLAKLKGDYEYVLVLLPTPEVQTAVSRVLIDLVDEVFIVAERAKTKKRTVETIKSILSKRQTDDPLLVIV